MPVNKKSTIQVLGSCLQIGLWLQALALLPITFISFWVLSFFHRRRIRKYLHIVSDFS